MTKLPFHFKNCTVTGPWPSLGLGPIQLSSSSYRTCYIWCLFLQNLFESSSFLLLSPAALSDTDDTRQQVRRDRGDSQATSPAAAFHRKCIFLPNLLMWLKEITLNKQMSNNIHGMSRRRSESFDFVNVIKHSKVALFYLLESSHATTKLMQQRQFKWVLF